MSNSENAFDAENIERTNTYQNLAQELSKELSAESWEKMRDILGELGGKTS